MTMRSTISLVDDGRDTEPVLTDLSPAAASSTAGLDTDAPEPTVDTDDGPYPISGVALGVETTRNQSGAFEWTPSAVETLGPTLADGSLADDHPDDGKLVLGHPDAADSVVGDLTASSFNAETEEIEFEGTTPDPEIARKVARGELEASPRIRHAPKPLLSRNFDGSRQVDADAAYRAVHLALVPEGAGDSQTVSSGPLPGTTTGGTAARTLFDSSGRGAN